MALKLPIQTPEGTTLEYWRIIDFYIDFLNSHATVRMAGYVNKLARDSGKQPYPGKWEYIYKTNTFNFGTKDFNNKDLLSHTYDFIKNLNGSGGEQGNVDWTKSEDV